MLKDLKDLTIGVIGGGTVGRATAGAWVEHVAAVRILDCDTRRSTAPAFETVGSDILFLCLPTPVRGGRCDLSALANVCNDLRGRRGPTAIRSTVPPGTTYRLSAEFDLLGLCHYPEFLTARCAAAGAQMPTRNILGIVNANLATAQLRHAIAERFPAVPLFSMGSDESELAKLAVNAFFAVKVAFFNEVSDLAGKLGLDWDDVLDGIVSDGRISPSHTNVPGPDGAFGFGGACLPKDAAAFVAAVADAGGLPALVTAAAIERNAIDRAKEKR